MCSISNSTFFWRPGQLNRSPTWVRNGTKKNVIPKIFKPILLGVQMFCIGFLVRFYFRHSSTLFSLYLTSSWKLSWTSSFVSFQFKKFLALDLNKYCYSRYLSKATNSGSWMTARYFPRIAKSPVLNFELSRKGQGTFAQHPLHPIAILCFKSKRKTKSKHGWHRTQKI